MRLFLFHRSIGPFQTTEHGITGIKTKQKPFISIDLLYIISKRNIPFNWFFVQK